MEDEAVTSEKFLLLIDQLSVDQKRHLSIKDIGIILERLSSKILDVERLDRESESDDCYNWTIKVKIAFSLLCMILNEKLDYKLYTDYTYTVRFLWDTQVK